MSLEERASKENKLIKKGMKMENLMCLEFFRTVFIWRKNLKKIAQNLCTLLTRRFLSIQDDVRIMLNAVRNNGFERENS